MKDWLISEDQRQSLNKLDVQSLIALRAHYAGVAKANRLMDDISTKKKWEAQDWIEAIDACLKEPSSFSSAEKGVKINNIETPYTDHYKISEFEVEYLDYVSTNFAPKTKENAARALKCLKNYIGDPDVSSLTALDLENYKTSRKGKVSDTTINMEIRALKAAFSKAADWKKIPASPFKKVKEIKIDEKEKKHLTEEERDKILQSIKDQWIRDIGECVFFTGLRLGEVMNLKWTDYDEQKQQITVQSSDEYRVKGGKKRIIPIPDNVRLMLKRKKKKGAWIFLSGKNKKVSNNYVSKKFKKAVQKAGILGDYHFHSTRHSFITQAFEAGLAPHAIQQIVGHSNLKTTEGYLGTDQEFLAKEIQKLSPKVRLKKKEKKIKGR